MFLIRVLTLIAAIPLRSWSMLQRATGKISTQTYQNRLGYPTAQTPAKPVLWFHGASLGECVAVRPFLRYITQNHPDHAILITTNNPDAHAVISDWSDIPSILQVAPFDFPNTINRFLNFWSPVAFANIETEVWPNRFAALKHRNIPMVGVNARLSASSLKKYMRIGRSLGLHNFSSIFAQNEQSAQYLQTFLGVDVPVKTTPNLKSLVVNPMPDNRFSVNFERSQTILAASTHPGEDEIILGAFKAILQNANNLKLIIAPRHVKRSDDVMNLAKSKGLLTERLGENSSNSNVYIVDQLGLLPKLYNIAALTIVGGSLLPDIGGHTPYEPAYAKSAIITGPYVYNFSKEYETLQSKGGAIIASPDDLTSCLERALKAPEVSAQNAYDALASNADPSQLFEEIALCMGLKK